VLVLRIDLEEGKGRQSLADAGEGHPRGPGTAGPQVDGRHLEPAGHDRIRQIELAVQLERPGLHRERARGGAGGIGPVDDAYPDTLPPEPQGEDEPRGPGADDENLGWGHTAAPWRRVSSALSCSH
jgi:hypothetical protein